MNRLITQWKNISLAKKLYGIIGLMAILIILELFTLWFAMNTLSAVRAFVGGEGLWSKAQKDAIFTLQTYAVTQREEDYVAFLEYLKVSDGDRLARAELKKANPDLDVVRQGFIQGGNHPDDIDQMIKLLQRFHEIKYISQALEAWANADQLIEEIRRAGQQYHTIINSPGKEHQRIRPVLLYIQDLNQRMTKLEDSFSNVLGQGSRWLESVIIGLLSIVVLMVEGIGLSLAFMTTRAISHGLELVSVTANAIGHGEFDRRIEIKSRDEIGVLAAAINGMGEMLQKSYGELETRVNERTAELAQAVRARDDFLSIASHELRTPVTSMKLQVDMIKRSVEKGEEHLITAEKVLRLIRQTDHGLHRINRLVEDMLDITRIQTGKLHIDLLPGDLVQLVRETLERFEAQLANAGIQINFSAPPEAVVLLSSLRMEQVLANLITNGIRYAPNAPMEVAIVNSGTKTTLTVQDHGSGVAKENQERIFQRFERLVPSTNISGLGLGLYIAREIVQSHGGKIGIVSETGMGARFVIELPLYNPNQS